VIVTRILQADVPAELAGICKVMGFVRADIWRRFGALREIVITDIPFIMFSYRMNGGDAHEDDYTGTQWRVRRNG
jgi:hypothetical protein